MRKHFHRFALIILFLFVGVNIFGSAQVYADPAGGGFNVPQINDEFNKGKQAPPPQQEESVAQSSQEEDGFWKNVWDWTTGTVSKGWEKTKETVTNAWESTKEGVASAWNWTVDTATKGWNWAVDTATKAWNWTVDALTAAWEWTVDKATKVWEWTVDIATKIWDWTVDTLTYAWDWITNFVVENVKFIFGLFVLGVAGYLFTRRGYALGNKLMVQGARLIGVDNSRPYGQRKDVKVDDLTLARASQAAYFFETLSDDQVTFWLGDGWRLVRIDERNPTGPLVPNSYRNLPNGLQAVMFVNDGTHEVIIAFRGTEFKKPNDVVTDATIGVGLDIVNPQLHSAREFVEEALNNPKYQGYQFVLTGHSLGGYLANDAGHKYKVPTFTFNAAGKNLFPNVNASTVAPAALGAKAGPGGAALGTVFGVELTGATYVINMLDPDNRKQAINEYLGKDDDLIVNYNFNHDLVGGVGFRSGETYYIDEKGQETRKVGLDNDLLNLNFDAGSTHSIMNFTGLTDKGRNYNSSISKIIYKHNGNIVPR
ncbi:hypothetical protein ACFO25_00670 [Paenactinomyces guangxiensis]|uniref:Uncharacterized protein n=1 Tax=Paenactinomyces guangxiensis TaxID=1490290 RepID=A0A7W1WUU9_9BACL|nr:hypothetical protein [Paenactinomyces guangxiensis]MBA4496408.1 hypothetical protein [Paenactinomyces guangxiensis]MBH8593479.1 hypothetical protein [Paenactinomyces guangxiensis]